MKLMLTIPLLVCASNPAAPTSGSAFRLVFDVSHLVGEPAESTFTLEVRPDWAPVGAQRLQELVEAKFFDGVGFFRVIDKFMVQFGIHGDPSVMRKWENKNIKDDKARHGISNTRGKVSFATAGPNTRTTQLFVNFGDNSFLDRMGFTPVAEVVHGMDVVDRIFKVGEGAPSGPGPSQGQLQARGNAYLAEHFPKLSYIKSCREVIEGEAVNSKARSEAITQPPQPVLQDLGHGLKLSVTRPGDGKTFPQVGDRLTMHYTLTVSDDGIGRVIDSSRSRHEPFTFTIGRGQVIRGWDIGIMKMSLGERGVLTVPSGLGYGARGTRGIPPNKDLTFDVEVLGIGDHVAAVAGLAPSSGPLVASTLAIIVFISLGVLF